MNRPTRLVLMSSAALAALTACGVEPVVPAARTVTVTRTSTVTRTFTVTSTPGPTGATARFMSAVDGDTIQTSAGEVRVIGIDSPEQRACGADKATANVTKILLTGSTVTLTSVTTKDDRDKYGRLLRYVVSIDGRDLGMEQINAGLAKAKYDSRDGYGAHPREAEYIAMDAKVPDVTCPTPTPAPKAVVKVPPKPAPTVTTERTTSKPQPPPAAVYYANCSAARAAGVAPVYVGEPGYRPGLDRDKDGVACE